MCLSPAALAAFLSLLSPDVISMSPGTVTVHADLQDVTYVRVVNTWCSGARPLRTARLLKFD